MTTERPRPYVGVSGVANYENRQPSGLVIREPQDLFVEAYAHNVGLFETDRLLALGVKATHKTQFQDKENKYGRDWYPVGEEGLANALRHSKANPNTLAVAQTYLDINHVQNSEYRRVFVNHIVERGRAWIQAIQFDMLPWHDNDDMLEFLGEVKEDYDVKILLQCYGRAMEELGPKDAVQKLGRHAASIDYVLFDASHGTGKRMDAGKLDGFLDEAYSSDALAGVGFAVAGGLNASAVREDLPALLEKYPDLSWDAEGQLHPLNNAGKRPLQMDYVRDYLQASVDSINA